MDKTFFGKYLIAIGVGFCSAANAAFISNSEFSVYINGLLGSSKATTNLFAIQKSSGATQRIEGAFDPRFLKLLSFNENQSVSQCKTKACVAVLNYTHLASDNPFDYELQFYTLPELELVESERIEGTIKKNIKVLAMSSLGNLQFRRQSTCVLGSGSMGGIGCEYTSKFFIMDQQQRVFKTDKKIDISTASGLRNSIDISPSEKSVIYLQQSFWSASPPSIRLQHVDLNSRKLSTVVLRPNLELPQTEKLLCLNFINDDFFYVLTSEGNIFLYSSKTGSKVDLLFSKVSLNSRYTDYCEATISNTNLSIKIGDDKESQEFVVPILE